MPNAHDHPNDARPPAQHSFLVRFWRTAPRGTWHATLQRGAGEPAMHFAGIDLMFAFLLVQLGEDASPLNHADDDSTEAPDKDAFDSPL